LVAAGGPGGAVVVPTISFGVLAGVQYADTEMVNGRQYRCLLDKLQSPAGCFAGVQLEFVIQLGDLVDAWGYRGSKEGE